MTHVFDHLPRNRYRVIYADPPWTFETYSEKGKDRSPERHYRVMTLNDIKALPVRKLAADDCVLFLWTTWPHLWQAREVIEAWGFTYRTLGFVWVKLNPSQKYLKFQLLRAACSNFCVGYPRMALVPPVLRST
jgi:N6-adenosine-specific RNA methylase IME4